MKENEFMKKKKKQEQKKKEFIHTPFNALKGFTSEKSEKAAMEKAPPKPAAKAIEEDERSLFLRAVSDV